MQAWRQPGSSFKPFIYSAALEKGYTPATLVEDAPLNFTADETGDKEWSPKNYESVFDGPVSIRHALAKSINTVAIRVLQSIDVNYAQKYITRFGFSTRDVPAYLTMALGAGSTTPWQMAVAYSVFANGGYRVKPNLISKIVDKNGQVVLETKFEHAGKNAQRAIGARNAFIMNSMMQSVIRGGTAARALQLGRSDIAGKTGTTNDLFDAWFAGYSPNQVAVTWVGFDRPQTLGRGETGAVAALPIWMKYMAIALRNTPELNMEVPEGVETINVDPATGVREESGVAEYFYQEYPPPELEVLLPPSTVEVENLGEPQTSKVQQLLPPEVSSTKLNQVVDAKISPNNKVVDIDVVPNVIHSKKTIQNKVKLEKKESQHSAQQQAARLLSPY
jgi:penicillin-binding protein 1A